MLPLTRGPLHDLFANEEKTANLRTAISERWTVTGSSQAPLLSQASWSDTKVVLWNIYSATHC